MLFLKTSFAQDTLVAWTFPTGTAIDSVTNISIPINSSSVIKTEVGTSAINYSTNGFTNFCAQATSWNDGMDAKYWLVKVITTGYENLKISSRQRAGGSNAGPKDFKIQYKISSSGIWTDVVGSAIVCDNDFTTSLIDGLSLPDTLNDQSSEVYLRWVMTSNLGINGSAVAINGISKIDDIVISGTQINNGIKDFNKTYVKIFPNPATNILNIILEEKSKIELYDIIGNKLADENGNNINLSLANYSNGYYIVRISKNNIVENYKLIINK